MKFIYLFITLGLAETYTKAQTTEPQSTINKENANTIIDTLYKQLSDKLKISTATEMMAKKIIYKELSMPYQYITYGEKPDSGHSLYISMHGGGGAPAKVNDGQWRNQIKLYKPKEGIYLAPRAPTDTWNLWHQPHIDPMFDAIIDRFIAHHDINPNKVYITGYSAGGDGTYQLAPRMADRWAGAAMMAGHPGDAKTPNLLNLPYFIQCGGKDIAYNRNKLTQNWGKKLDKLEKENPTYYTHKWIVYPQHGHWMNLDCKQAIPWIAKHTRNPWPKKINWQQDDVTHTRFYWLANQTPNKNDLITAEVNGQTITLTTENVTQITLRLNDALINLDKEIIVQDNKGNNLFKGIVPRSKAAIIQSLKQRLDKTTVATALLEVTL